jgi:hypothetical protein
MESKMAKKTPATPATTNISPSNVTHVEIIDVGSETIVSNIQNACNYYAAQNFQLKSSFYLPTTNSNLIKVVLIFQR